MQDCVASCRTSCAIPSYNCTLRNCCYARRQLGEFLFQLALAVNQLH